MNTVYTYVVYRGQILYPQDFPSLPEHRNGRAVVRFELPPKVKSHRGVFDVTFADEYTLPCLRRRFTFRTVRHFGFAGEYVSRPDAERIIDKFENITLRKELHGAEKHVKECKDKLFHAIKTRRRLSRAQCAFVIATRNLLKILLSLGIIDADELRHRMLKCDEYLRSFC